MGALFAQCQPAAQAAVVATNHAFTVPLEDMDEFGLLKTNRRKEVLEALQILSEVHALRMQPGRNYIASTDALAASYSRRGFSGKTLRRRYDEFIKAGQNWRELVKDYKGPTKQNPAYVQYVRGMIDAHHGCARAAWAKIMAAWRSGQPVPGYGTWREWFASKWTTEAVPKHFPNKYPVGMSYRTLLRYAPSKFQKKLFASGYGSAHSLGPQIRLNTAKLRPLEWIAIDDFELDAQCYFKGDRARGISAQIAYVGGLIAIDVATRKRLHWVIGPMVEVDEPTADGKTKKVRRHLSQIDVQGLLYGLFAKHGLPAEYPCQIICENATASISEDTETMLRAAFGGRITVRRTDMVFHRTLANGFSETGGTPWQKGWLESGFNITWNRLKNMPGYKGSNERLNAPGGLERMRKYAARFLGQGARKLNLTPEELAQVQMPFADIDELGEHLAGALELVENNSDHHMLGFDDVTEFRWPDPALPPPPGIDAHALLPWASLSLLTPAQRTEMVPVPRKQTIAERWDTLTAAHARVAIAPATLQLFMLSPNRSKVRNHSVSFTRKGQGYTYITTDEQQAINEITDGTPVLAYVDFANPATALITLTDGKPVGILRQLGVVGGIDCTDTAAVNAARAAKRDWIDREVQDIRSRPLNQEADAQLAAMRENNATIEAAALARQVSVPVADRLAQAGAEAAAEQHARREAGKLDQAAIIAADIARRKSDQRADDWF